MITHSQTDNTNEELIELTDSLSKFLNADQETKTIMLFQCILLNQKKRIIDYNKFLSDLIFIPVKTSSLLFGEVNRQFEEKYNLIMGIYDVDDEKYDMLVGKISLFSEN